MFQLMKIKYPNLKLCACGCLTIVRGLPGGMQTKHDCDLCEEPFLGFCGDPEDEKVCRRCAGWGPSLTTCSCVAGLEDSRALCALHCDPGAPTEELAPTADEEAFQGNGVEFVLPADDDPGRFPTEELAPTADGEVSQYTGMEFVLPADDDPGRFPTEEHTPTADGEASQGNGIEFGGLRHHFIIEKYLLCVHRRRAQSAR